MAEKRRRFSREFKLEAARLATTGDRSVAQVARELGIRADMLHKWERETRAKSDAFPGNGNLSAQEAVFFVSALDLSQWVVTFPGAGLGNLAGRKFTSDSRSH